VQPAGAESVFTWLRNGTIAAPALHTFPLERAEDALRSLESRKSTGKCSSFREEQNRSMVSAS
jgi:hypothetical protein